MKRSVLIGLLAGVMGMCLTACGGGKSEIANATHDENTVKIAYLPITHALPVFEEAEELKGSTGLNVELVKYGSWPELLDALNTGRVDGASVLIELAMKSKAQGIGIKAVALGHRDGNVIVVNKNINTMADLKGKTFAIPHRQSSHNILLNEALALNNMSLDDIKITELSPAEMPSALVSKQIDGYCVAEPFGARAVALDVAKVLYTSEELWEDSLCCGLVLTDTFIDEKPELAKEFVASYKTAGENLDVSRTKEIGKTYLKQEDAILDVSLEWISFDNLEITKEAYENLVQKVKKYGLLDNPPTYEEFVKTEF
ncbi:ABC transporter substrate-binding protein [Cellulosilyticum ruminicola]|uniref:ABC transporter substrate-binding protein n=1 Tax=Cellulosilyticum ruminicola TaxID=425254 RepID=UPI0006D016C1|nr:ABC transporter substrate-binding protein [Cellulosilyticum ruminicola]